MNIALKKFIRELKEKEQFATTFLVTDKNVGTDKNGKVFLSLSLADSSGQLNARMFEKAQEATSEFEVGDVVMIRGFVQLFQNRKQILVHELRKALEGEFKIEDLISSFGGDPKAHLQDLKAIVKELKNEFVSKLLENTLNDPQLEAKLLAAPAAKTIHHAYRGGLIEHIHSIVNLMKALHSHYGFLDLDLLVFGAIYHDLGKVHELDLREGIHYTHSGRLVGHMVLACEMVEQYSKDILWFPEELKDVLKHIILAHHGKLEYGSPKLPMLAEAMVVAMIDDLDSKINTLHQFLKREVENQPPEEKWSHFHPGFERYFLLDFFRKRQES